MPVPTLKTALAYERALDGQAAGYDLADPQSCAQSAHDHHVLFNAIQQVIKPDGFLEIGLDQPGYTYTLMESLPDTVFALYEPSPYARARHGITGEIPGLRLYTHAVIGPEEGQVPCVETCRPGQEGLRLYHDLDVKEYGLVRPSIYYKKFAVPAIGLEKALRENGVMEKTNSLKINSRRTSYPLLHKYHEILKYVDSVYLRCHGLPDSTYSKEMIVQHLLMWGLVPVSRSFESPENYTISFVNTRWIEDPELRWTVEQHVDNWDM